MYWIKAILVLILVFYLLCGLFLYLFQDRLVFMPEALEDDFVFEFEADFNEINLEMEDGAVLNALHFKTSQPKGLIVYFHGNAGNLSRWGEVVLPFVDRGYEVLIVDYRGYGKSTGKRSKKAMLNDSEVVYAYATNLWPQEKVIVYGRSLGSSFATHVGRQFSPGQIILESPFFSVADVARGIAWMYPVKQIMRFNFQNGKSTEIAAPITILHGTEDLVVPFASGQKLSEAIKGSEFHPIEGGGHNDLANFKRYWDVIDKKLE